MPAERTHDELLKQYLADHDAPCPVCSYNLRGLTAEKCPECGAPIELGVRSNESRLREWIIGLIAWATGFGTSGMMVMAFGVAWARSGSLPRPITPLIPMVAGLAVCSVGLVAWLKRLRAIRKMQLAKRMTLALISWPIALAWIVAFWLLIP